MSQTVLVYEARHGVTPVLVLTGLPSAAVMADLERRVQGVDHHSHRHIVIDLLGVQALDLSGLVALCSTLRRAGARGLALMVVVSDPRVAGVLDTCQIPGLQRHRTISAALAETTDTPRSRIATALLRRLGIHVGAQDTPSESRR